MTAFFSKHKQFNTKQIFLSVALVCALLFSFISHSQHSELSHDGAEQRCHLCQNKIDNVENKLQIFTTESYRYIGFLPATVPLYCSTTFYVLPQLRAPPVKINS